MKTIKLKLDHIITDRVQYKPYVNQLSGENVFVQVSLKDEHVLKQKDDETILTVDGLAAVLSEVATAIETMHDKHTKKKFNI